MSDPDAPQSRRQARERADAVSPAPESAPSAEASDSGGSPFAAMRQHPRVFIGLAIALAIVVLGCGAFALGSALAPASTASGPADNGDAAPARDAPDDPTAPQAVATCSVATLASAAALGGFAGWIGDASSGSQVFSRAGSESAASRGTLELFTAAAADQVLGASSTLATTVYSGTEPGEIVLVGGGDPTLTALPAGQQGVYPNPSRLADLATQVQQALAGQAVTKITVDASLWPESDSWPSAWNRKLVGAGYLAPVTALQVDAGRTDPTKEVSPRSPDPVQDAAKAFATALGVPDVEIADGTVADGATQLGQVQSQPVSSLVSTMLQLDDAQLAEQLARLIAVKSGGDGTLASYGNLIPQLVTNLGIDSTGATIVDGSGLSAQDAVPPKFLAAVAAMLHDGQDDLGDIYNAIAVAGQSGALLDRFTGDAASARGAVAAQTGRGTMTGIITAQDGTVLEFSFSAANSTAEADAALDALAAGVFSCGANLSNH